MNLRAVANRCSSKNLKDFPMNKKAIGSTAAAFLLSTAAAGLFLTQPSMSHAADAAAEAEAPSLNGTIVDGSGKLMAGVVLEWNSSQQGASFRTMTAPDGAFRLAGITSTRDGSLKILSPAGMAFKSQTGSMGGTLSARSIENIVYGGGTTVTDIKIVADAGAALKPIEYVREVNLGYTLQPIADLALPKNKRLTDDLTPAPMWDNKSVVAGRVEDGKGNVVGRVTVNLIQVNGSTTWTQRQTSALDGEFRFGDIPSGNYKLVVEGPDGIKVAKMAAPAGSGTAGANSIDGIAIAANSVFKGAVVTVDLSGVKQPAQ
jgi:hypothetical protein